MFFSYNIWFNFRHITSWSRWVRYIQIKCSIIYSLSHSPQAQVFSSDEPVYLNLFNYTSPTCHQQLKIVSSPLLLTATKLFILLLLYLHSTTTIDIMSVDNSILPLTQFKEVLPSKITSYMVAQLVPPADAILGQFNPTVRKQHYYAMD